MGGRFCYTLYMANMEREYKWDASARGAFGRFERALAAELAGGLPVAQDVRITDYYLDNARGDFSAQKIALRVRRENGFFEATLKTRTALVNGLARRKEWTKPLPQARSLAQALKMLQRCESWQGARLLGLRVRFKLHNHRRIYIVRVRALQCEAALDRYVVTAAGKRQARREIELELKKGEEKQFAALLARLNRRCGLEPAVISKVAGAEKLLREKA